MNEWWNLFKKEYRMTRTTTFIKLGILLFLGLWGLNSNWIPPGAILAPAFLLIVFAAFYPAIFMFKYINKEFKQAPHLWLHSPQPAWMLLSAKLVVGLAVMLAILLLDAVFIYMSISDLQQTGFSSANLTLLLRDSGFYLLSAIVGFSIYMASWSTLIIVVTASARKILGRYKWLAGFAAFYLGTWGVGKLQQTWLFERLTQWGAFRINLISANKIQFVNNQHGFPFGGIQIYTGQILIIVIATLALFALSSWLIDKKVEV
ncbi:hypothetical protein Dtox_1630 [Desulfofarcimen acetoxidans DSM 771]|jgi:hypothetical protein|uniref:ABC transporter, permease protein n=1 Tax=Desulfofarcimen acetoxidans (strain ATCC 49208 / DSM 771 / KCTC 5769 / VKM B-1644 / 5575) TaxID=485916 RepID=C8VWD5_DESAS|nr:hypothetical protein [Desulfofarcimen acetoxidans]ACV62487.1 hypothetical protein Dtox_1630 [Desulfofarcimen acetoxidans DSM 771]